jgi:hypothetical protein
MATFGIASVSGRRSSDSSNRAGRSGKVTNFQNPDGIILDLFSEDQIYDRPIGSTQQFTRAII